MRAAKLKASMVDTRRNFVGLQDDMEQAINNLKMEEERNEKRAELLTQREAGLDSREADLERQEADLERREADLDRREKQLEARIRTAERLERGPNEKREKQLKEIAKRMDQQQTFLHDAIYELSKIKRDNFSVLKEIRNETKESTKSDQTALSMLVEDFKFMEMPPLKGSIEKPVKGSDNGHGNFNVM